MRDQMTELTQRSEERHMQFREELGQQMEHLKKKVILGQGNIKDK